METKTNPSTGKENPLRADKRKKIEALVEKGVNPWPHEFKPTHRAAEVIEAHNGIGDGTVLEDQVVTVAGRLMTKRDMGKASFFDIQDQTGRLQVYIRPKDLTEEEQTHYSHLAIGDLVGVTGFVFKTKKGQLSVHAQKFCITCKTLEPLPEKYHGLTDVELKYRQRHLDLIMSPETRAVFQMRSQIKTEIRNFLNARGFLEVDTPILQPIYGGAAAYPFKTHHRALDMELFMRISPELYLKRLTVGGFEKVYEMGRVFRNEGIDRSHNPEFELLEWYEAYTDYNYQMKQFEDLVSTVAERVTGSTKVEYQGQELDFTTPWRRLSVVDGIIEYGKFDPRDMSEDELFKKIKSLGSDLEKPSSHGEMVMEAFELIVEEHLFQPTFIIDFPVEVSPLTKSHRDKKGLVERFEPIVAGMELGNAYTELNDPVEQRKRLEAQEAKRVVDEEAQPMDEDFLHAIEVGMPPTGGVGLGIERLVLLLTNQPSIRDILFFPTMRHK